MNIFKAPPIILAIIIFVTAAARAEDPLTIPNTLWEQHPEGVALAVRLSYQNENGFLRNAVEIFIKNTSSSLVECDSGGKDWGIRIFYVNSSGQKIALRNYKRDVIQRQAPPDIIKPGDTLSRKIDLTSDELLQAKSRPVCCAFNITILSSKAVYTIESTAKMLPSEP